MATMTLIGLYNFDDTIFENLTVPEDINKDTLIDNILMRSGDFEVMYPDPVFLKYSIGAWSRKWNPTIERWVKALKIDYNPLENYDRFESWSDTNTGTQTTDDTGTQTMKNTGTQTTTNTGTQTSVGSGSESTVRSGNEVEQGDGGNTTENQTSAYDDNTYSPKTKTIFDTDQSNTRTYNDVTDTHTLNDLTSERTDDLTAERTDDLTAERTDKLKSKRTDDLKSDHEGRIHGNIGVTTSQQMLKSELDLGYWNIYEKITDLFLTEFVIPVY